MKLYISICVMVSFIGFSQQNLIPNGSFENIRPTIFDYLNDADLYLISNLGDYVMYSNHFTTNPDNGLFHCWRHSSEGTSVDDVTFQGISYGIIPGFFPVIDGNQQSPLDFNASLQAIRDNTAGTDKRILALPSSLYGLRLEQNGITGLQGFDCDPPTTKFGYNVSAAEGSNYVAFVDYKFGDLYPNNGQNGKPQIQAKLEYKLEKDVKYILLFSVAQMNRIGEIAANEGWIGGLLTSGVKEPEIRILVGDANFNVGTRQEIVDFSFEHNDWVEYAMVFTANDDYEHIGIIMDPLGQGGSARISGCFIDNLKLYEYCEEPENQCLNANYRDDLLDVKLSDSEYGDPLAYPDASQGNNDYLQTIKATNLENVERLEMKIFYAYRELCHNVNSLRS